MLYVTASSPKSAATRRKVAASASSGQTLASWSSRSRSSSLRLQDPFGQRPRRVTVDHGRRARAVPLHLDHGGPAVGLRALPMEASSGPSVVRGDTVWQALAKRLSNPAQRRARGSPPQCSSAGPNVLQPWCLG